ncbi:MAG: hypothetical protein KDA92_21810, partial [Planctomycetales bacterium]|nr:hypothetical protein [Planctomycetales bacterium]
MTLPLAQSASPPDPPAPAVRRISQILLIGATLVAVGIAVYLSYMKLSGQISNLAGCGGEAGCASLLGSRWSNWMKVPVSLWALGVYGPLLVLACLGLNTPTRRRLALVATSVLVSVACWFLVVQIFFEGKFCPYCCAMHFCSLLAFISVAILSMPYPPRENLRHMTLAIPLAAVCVATLAAGQMWGPQVA